MEDTLPRRWMPGGIDLNNVPIRFMNFSNKPTYEIVAT
jgi:hypothetical protein